MITTYGDITPRTAAYAVMELLERATPYLCLEKFGQAKALPSNSSTSMKWRKYTALAANTTALTEGVTPPSKKLAYSDISLTLYQYGKDIAVLKPFLN